MHVLATHGREFATIENEAGERRIIFIRWTSLVPQAAYELPSGAVARLCPETAHQLAVWVEQRGLAKEGRSDQCP